MSYAFKGLTEQEATALTAKVNEMMKPGGEYDPFDVTNLYEAMTKAEDEQIAPLASALRANDAVAATAALHLIAREYWFNVGCDLQAASIQEDMAEPDLSHPFSLECWEREMPLYFAKQAH